MNRRQVMLTYRFECRSQAITTSHFFFEKKNDKAIYKRVKSHPSGPVYDYHRRQNNNEHTGPARCFAQVGNTSNRPIGFHLTVFPSIIMGSENGSQAHARGPMERALYC
jgi:hypothetical protein